MAKVIAIMGESGSGKTTSFRNLDPKETFYIDADGKGLSWKGWAKDYSAKNGNYVKTDDVQKIYKLLDTVNGTKVFTLADNEFKIEKPQTQFKYLVIDTLNAIMVNDEMVRAKEKGYDKWMDLAQSVYVLVKYMGKMRDDLTVFLIFHTEVVNEDNGYKITRIATSGRKLQKIKLETMLNTVLLARCDGGNEFKFITHNDGFTTAKTPMGAFEEDEVENDIVKVIEALAEF